MIFRKIISKVKKKEIFGFILVFICLVFVYRDIFLHGKIIFPSNFLAQSYSPWSTEKFEGWENGIPHKPIGGNDQIRFFYPLRTFTTENLKKGIIPLWNPFIFSGNPHMADFQSAVFYPLNILYNLLPEISAWSVLVFIQPLLGMIFAYLYLRLFISGKIAAFLGAIAFGFSGFIISWSQENSVVSQTAIWLPLILFGIEKFVRTKLLLYFLLSVASLTFCFLAGFFQIAFYIFILAFIYTIFRFKEEETLKLKNFILSVLIFIFPLAIGGVQLLPSIEAFLESPRSTTSASYIFNQYLLPVTHIANALTPDIFGNPGSYNFFGRTFYNETVLYIGLIPLFFAVYSLIKFRGNKIVSFFASAAALSFFLTINTPFTKWFFDLPIPLLSTFVPTRILTITTFSLSVISAFGFSFWIEEKSNKKNENIIFGVFGLILFFELIYGLLLLSGKDLSQINNYIIRPESHLKKEDILVMLKNLLLPSLLLLSSFFTIKFLKKYSAAAIILVGLTILSQFYFLNKYLVLGLPQFLYPNHPVFSFLQKNSANNRFLALGEPILSDISVEKKIYSPEGLDPIYPNNYGQLLYYAKTGVLTNNIPRIEASISDLREDEKVTENKKRLRLLSILGVKYIAYFENSNSKISLSTRFPSSDFTLLKKYKNWYIFEYKNSLPRVFTTDKFTVENNKDKVLSLIFSENFDLSNIILPKKPSVLFSNISKELKGSSKILNYEVQKIEISTQTNKQSLLFLSDNYYPGWKAYVDGKETKIYRADYTFRAIEVPEGNHKETFIYDPMYFRLGVLLSSFSLVLFLILLVKGNRRR